MVKDTIASQKLQADELTVFYIVQLLAGRLERSQDPDEALAIRYRRALNYGGMDRRKNLRRVGDESLFVSGFFSDSLKRRLVDLDYYVSIGSSAYETLCRCETRDTFAPVFFELADKFVGFVDVLSEISERTRATRDADLLRLYEKWLLTGSKRASSLLAEQGIVPNASLTKLRVQ
jgi:hypothetical protein